MSKEKTMKMKRWLVYYKQRAHGTDRWAEANGVTDQHPATFLLGLLERFPDHESVLMWAMEINAVPPTGDDWNALFRRSARHLH